PGPGSYDCVSSSELFSPSFSKRGTSGFIESKAPRRTQEDVPGPNSYNLQRSFINKHDFSVGVSRFFRSPVAVQLDGPKHRTPAPNQYQVGSDTSRTSSAGSSPFLSKTSRDWLRVNKDVPSPAHYEVSCSLIHAGTKAFSSPFRSRTQRLPAAAENRVLGPGAYSPHQPAPVVKKTPLRCCLVIAQPAQVVQKNLLVPGPGHYDVGTSDQSSKRLRPSAAFASRTERMLPNLRAETTPGPGKESTNPSVIYLPSEDINMSHIT
uniref:Sperm-tail PG-rich repeat containing 1 n=1 Tax=Kryptolebias marmoratus TaxID=37003 RepID=A0A3Q2ZZT6_KRYMA